MIPTADALPHPLDDAGCMATNAIPSPADRTRDTASAVRAGMLSILAWMGVYVGMGLLALAALGVTAFIAVQVVTGNV